MSATPAAAFVTAQVAGAVNVRTGVAQILLAAAGADAGARQSAHQRLQELESKPGFATLLLDTYADPAVDPQGRRLAVLACKSVIDRRWQPRNGQCMVEEEKQNTKEGMLQLISVAVRGNLPHLDELSLVLRRICRSEFPKQWDELAHLILNELKRLRDSGVFDEGGIGIIVVLHHILKEQSTKKLMAARKDFHQIGQVMIEPLGAVWCLFSERLKGLLGKAGVVNPDQSENCMVLAPDAADDRTWKLSRYLDGCFQLLLAHGFAKLHETPQGPELVVLVKDRILFLINVLKAHPVLVTKCPYFAKNVKSAFKWLTILLHGHPLSFTQADLGAVLASAVDVLQMFASRPRQGLHVELQLRESLVKSSMTMLTHAFNSLVFRQGPQQGHQGCSLEAAQSCHAQFSEFTRRIGIGRLCELGAAVALEMPAEEVQEWLSDPEDQVLGPGAMTELRVAGEAFVKAMATDQRYADDLVKYIAQRMHDELSRPPTTADSYEDVARKDAFLSLLSLCQPQLKQHLSFEQLMVYASPVVALATQAPKQSQCVLLPVRLCAVIKAWCTDAEMCPWVGPILGLLQTFMREDCPKAVRLAAVMGPLRAIIGRFPDHEALSQVQGQLIDGCLALLSELKAPEVQWRCLHLVHTFLCEEAENGQYQATDHVLQRLLLLWRQPSDGEYLIRLALLDVLRAVVLMSCRSRKSRHSLSPALLNCALSAVSDCYSQHQPNPPPTDNQGLANGAESAALLLDATSAASSLGDQGCASATVFDSGCLLFIGILRTVDAAQSVPILHFFPQLLANNLRLAAKNPALYDGAMDILLEYFALCVELNPNAQELQPHFGSVLELCRGCIQSAPKGRNSEVSFALLQIMLAHAATAETLSQLRGLLVQLLNYFIENFNPNAPVGNFDYPLQALLQVFCTWHSWHPQDFLQNVVGAGRTDRCAALLVAGCRKTRPLATRATAVLAAALALASGGCGGAVADGEIWREMLAATSDLLTTSQRSGTSVLLVQMLQAMKSSLATKLPAPTRSSAEIQACQLPPELRSCISENGSADEANVVRWFLRLLAEALRRLEGRTSAVDVQVLLNTAPQQVQAALRASRS